MTEWEQLPAGTQKKLEAILRPGREVIRRDHLEFERVAKRHHWSPTPRSDSAADTADPRWIPSADVESLFVLATHYTIQRLIVTKNLLDGIERLTVGHVPIFSLYPMVRALAEAAGRIAELLLPPTVEERAGAVMAARCYSLHQQAKLVAAVGAAEGAGDSRGQARRVAARYGYAIVSRDGRRIRDDERPGRMNYERLGDGQAVDGLLRHGTNRGDFGVAMHRLLSAYAHADPIRVFDHLKVTPGDEAYLSYTTSHLDVSRVSLMLGTAHLTVGRLMSVLRDQWGWDTKRFQATWAAGTSKLRLAYPDSGAWSSD